MAKAFNYQRNDYRTAASRAAANRVVTLCDDERMKVVSIGGGPFRIHPNIINLNIGKFANVDIVGDAHRLPFASDSIDAVYCEAVFEHLQDPAVAAAEVRRVLKSGSVSFICTPFMQAFHGYPSHFQNFTIRGHERLFERAGLRVLESGTCVGPAWAVANVVAVFIAQYCPKIIRWPARAAWGAFANLFIRPLDKWLGTRDDAYVIASTTYVLLLKP